MHPLAIGFWGAFFGTASLMLLGAVAVARASRRVALSAATTALASAFFAVSYLGWLPVSDPQAQARLAALTGVFIGLVLWLMLMLDLGLLRERRARRRILAGAALAAVLAGAGAQLLPPQQGVVFSTLVAAACALAALAVSIVRARDGDRIASVGVLALLFMLLALAAGIWIVLDRPAAPWPVHATAALAGMGYVASIGVMLWQRYSYLIELREVRAQGPRYDPITRMSSNAATGQLVVQAFARQQRSPNRPVLLIAVTIANLYALENLHGRAALNHALFVCATRLRRWVPADIETGRLFEDGFLLVSRHAREPAAAARLGRLLARRLSRPINLATGASGPGGEPAPAPWVAQVGVGVLATTAQASPLAVVAQVRDMSRTAWSFASRVAWHDEAAGRIAELADLDTV